MGASGWDKQALDGAVSELLEVWRESGLTGDELHLSLGHEWETEPRAPLVEFVAGHAMGLTASESEYILYEDFEELTTLKADILREEHTRSSTPPPAEWLL